MTEIATFQYYDFRIFLLRFLVSTLEFLFLQFWFKIIVWNHFTVNEINNKTFLSERMKVSNERLKTRGREARCAWTYIKNMRSIHPKQIDN